MRFNCADEPPDHLLISSKASGGIDINNAASDYKNVITQSLDAAFIEKKPKQSVDINTKGYHTTAPCYYQLWKLFICAGLGFGCLASNLVRTSADEISAKLVSLNASSLSTLHIHTQRGTPFIESPRNDPCGCFQLPRDNYRHLIQSIFLSALAYR
ncbi:hypothetical protein PROFUN_10703 [Planoprotostelium fungivorum]|uniref:Uncharacterized protein n=1 Tax=Planoprotostelium fungivorum TaxID=1890364 RepID=A0A2P6N9L0_9EUKA|nr:hypothetical protein PROFUN_10703 [Planoprotostelium fungivorum]